jgi:hypothetical protein
MWSSNILVQFFRAIALLSGSALQSGDTDDDDTVHVSPAPTHVQERSAYRCTSVIPTNTACAYVVVIASLSGDATATRYDSYFSIYTCSIQPSADPASTSRVAMETDSLLISRSKNGD